MDHLRGQELIIGGFNANSNSENANITPTALALQLYVRCQGYIGSPCDYFGLAGGLVVADGPDTDTPTT